MTSVTGQHIMTTHCGMNLSDYLNACKAAGVGVCSLGDVMGDAIVRLNKLADSVRCGAVALTVARGRLRVIMADALSLCANIGKNDGWCYVMLDVKARDVLSFAGRLEVAAMKVQLMKDAM
ncbi:MAG: hypothetical protein ACRDCE_19815 [Cetobacterium sp.]|uniref:hypothetical protein n=1 Tax=Cetobacterium sp. TaxID=2071632 RepID=UPI003EE680F8